MRSINQTGIDLIKASEGLRLDVYKDVAGKPTVGYGHLITLADQLELGDTIDEKEAEDLLRFDLIKAEDAVESLVTVPLTDNQFAALVSFTFNLGRNNLAGSTLLKKLNIRDYNGAASEFKRWNRAGGKVVEGLITRRENERKLFLKKEVGNDRPYKTLANGDC